MNNNQDYTAKLFCKSVDKYIKKLKEKHCPQYYKKIFDLAKELIESHNLQDFFEINENAFFWKDRIKKKENNSVSCFKEEAIPESKSGVYFIGCTTFNPITGERFYYLKIGKAKDIKKRLTGGYGTHNPSYWNIDNLYCEDYSNKEKYYQTLLSTQMLGKGRNSNEWFEVSEEYYKNASTYGFKVFDRF